MYIPRGLFAGNFIRKITFILFLLLFLQNSLFYGNAEAEGSLDKDSLPFIEKLDPRDIVFKQYLSDVETGRRRLYGYNSDKNDVCSFLQIYAYSPKDDEDIFRLSARCNIPYSALATLNRFNHPDMPQGLILLPTVPGLFISESPGNDLERLISLSREMEEGIIITVPANGRAIRFLFFPGDDFNQTERSFFLNRGFRFPLRSYRISSPFGMRPSPFTGRVQRHNGVDLAAPIGTEVYATRDGKVTEIGNDSVFGNYIIIVHDDNWASLYGHLSAFSTTLHSHVTANTVIGKVGSTGQSTGPHLHFEMRKNGTSLDPSRLLFKP